MVDEKSPLHSSSSISEVASQLRIEECLLDNPDSTVIAVIATKVVQG
jgi:hypothetical protein